MHLRTSLVLTAFAASFCAQARAAEHITLQNGAEFDCVRHEPSGDRVRLYLMPAAPATSTASDSYLEVNAASILRVDLIPDLPAPTSAAATPSASEALTPAAMQQMLDHAGAIHNIDSDLLASIIHAESNGNARAVSRAGARGLMQLMPGTAAVLGVQNSFAPEQNISGGTAYLDQLLTRYHNDLRLAVAAYNAGPAAVDRYRGIPPFAETRAYVARVIREFNRRKRDAAPLAHTAAITTTSIITAN
jgi:soluble lytic murein transglycosylase-like protein